MKPELRIDDLLVAKTTPSSQYEATTKATKASYDFWNTGDEALLA